ncbi:uncharacterized protein N7511_003901 [Penicillium nucicola]|uniref:uncharacterized protein n=1 Tax=Penicillium nucicola TaxID=1850975 RepID=UPI002544F4FA|nr:uncharacterized protein N7511_003901 [Penicillium nucicola]KAJ5766285.1 hypothetical protein N7511_003901 [Penicillium nucicola]
MGLLSIFNFRKQPATIPTDTILPVHRWDFMSDSTHTVPILTFRFEAVLDPERLKWAFARLVTISEWRKLGARLRKNASGNLEYHVPSHFDEERPGVLFSSFNHQMKLSEHPLSPHLPESHRTPSLASDSSRDCLPLVTSTHMGRKLDDWLYSDIPLVSVHVVTFEDKTLVSVSYPHVLTDAQGFGTILKGWTAVLRGREDEVPVFQGFSTDPLASLGDNAPPTDLCYKKQTLSVIGAVVFGIRYVYGQLFHPCDQRILVVPEAYFDQIREQAMEELAMSMTKADQAEQGAPFLSHGDIVLAWWTKMTLLAHKASAKQVVSIISTMDVRTILTDYFGPGPVSFIGNAVVPLYTVAGVGPTIQRGVTYLANEIRKSISIQRCSDHVEATATHIHKSGNYPLVGNAFMQTVFCSNWYKAQYFEMDFSGALATPVNGSQEIRNRGRASCIIPNMLMGNGSPFNFTGLFIVGKTCDGSWILQTIMEKGAMKAFESSLTQPSG